MSDLPRRLWRVTFWKGLGGYPLPTRHELSQRTFGRAEDAGRFVASADLYPLHLRVVSVHTTETAWETVSAENLPRPQPRDPDDEETPCP